jgi:tRNA(Arg) A34 adenosine deaminase TadA
MKSTTSKILLGLLLGIVFMLTANQFYRLRGKEEISEELKTELTHLGEKALETKDVPVAAIVTYFDTIIGMGYNTVKRDFNLGGHAEINALSDAYSRFGDAFSKLDRSKLVLYTTFEPCEMCKGAIVNNRIENVFFEQNKSLADQTKLSVQQLWYELKKKRFDAPNLQENLFLQHPDYLGKK